MDSSYKGDPSEILQQFPVFNLQLLCCRYWWLSNWEFREQAFPYWRIYYNKQPGAYVVANGVEMELLPEYLYVISPNTHYATFLHSNEIPQEGFKLTGGRISDLTSSEEQQLLLSGAVEQLFIHFTIGYPYDNATSGIYKFPLTDNLRKKVETIIKQIKTNTSQFDFRGYLFIQTFICEILSCFESTHWDLGNKDVRVLRIISYIEANIRKKLSCDMLAEQVCMAKNSFAKIFKQTTGSPLHRFVQQKRIETACSLLAHSDMSIEQIAHCSGFLNRYHFSRVFENCMRTSPAKYRREITYSNHTFCK